MKMRFYAITVLMVILVVTGCAQKATRSGDVEEGLVVVESGAITDGAVVGDSQDTKRGLPNGESNLARGFLDAYFKYVFINKGNTINDAIETNIYRLTLANVGNAVFENNKIVRNKKKFTNVSYSGEWSSGGDYHFALPASFATAIQNSNHIIIGMIIKSDSATNPNLFGNTEGITFFYNGEVSDRQMGFSYEYPVNLSQPGSIIRNKEYGVAVYTRKAGVDTTKSHFTGWINSVKQNSFEFGSGWYGGGGGNLFFTSPFIGYAKQSFVAYGTSDFDALPKSRRDHMVEVISKWASSKHDKTLNELDLYFKLSPLVNDKMVDYVDNMGIKSVTSPSANEGDHAIRNTSDARGITFYIKTNSDNAKYFTAGAWNQVAKISKNFYTLEGTLIEQTSSLPGFKQWRIDDLVVTPIGDTLALPSGDQGARQLLGYSRGTVGLSGDLYFYLQK